MKFKKGDRVKVIDKNDIFYGKTGIIDYVVDGRVFPSSIQMYTAYYIQMYTGYTGIFGDDDVELCIETADSFNEECFNNIK